MFRVPALAGWLALWLLAACHASAASSHTLNPIWQAPPDLPPIVFDNFGPGIREQVKQAYDAAHQHPRDAQAVGHLGMVLQTYEDHELAAVCYQRAHKLAPRDFQWLYLLGTCQMALGNQSEAVATLRAALQQNADYLPAQLKLADALFATGAWRESQPLYEAIIGKHANLAQAYYGLGRIKAKRGATAAANEHLRRACELAPTWGAAHYALALAYRDAGDAAKAAEHLQLYQQHKNTRPPLADPLLNAVAELNSGATERIRAGIQLAAEGKLAESIAEHERALAINPQLTQAHINLIQLYGRTNQPAKAAKHYLAAVALNPNLAESHYDFGVVLVEQKQFAEAAQAFARAIAINPQFAEAHLNYGLLREQQQQYDEAFKHYRLAVEHRPNSRQAHFLLARLLIYKDQLAEAIKHLHQTLAPEDNETPRYVYALAAAYARAGDKANGLKYARSARAKAAALKQTELLALIERDLKILEQR